MTLWPDFLVVNHWKSFLQTAHWLSHALFTDQLNGFDLIDCVYACAHMLVHLHVITPTSPLSVIRLTCTIIISEPVVINLLTVTWLLLDLLVNDLILTALYVILCNGWTLGPRQALKFSVSHRFMSILTFKCLLCPFYVSCTHFTFKHKCVLVTGRVYSSNSCNKV